MQMARPADLDKVTEVSEPLCLKAAQLYQLSKDAAASDQTQSHQMRTDLPYCFFSALMRIKQDRGIDKFQKLNPANILAA